MNHVYRSIMLLIICNQVQAQSGGQISTILKHSYDCIESTEYRAMEGSASSISQEVLELLPKSKRLHYERQVFSDFNQRLKITINESSDAEEWEIMPYTIILDVDGIRILDQNGREISYLPPSLLLDSIQGLSQHDLELNQLDLFYELPEPSPGIIASLTASGITYTPYRWGYKIESAFHQLEVNHQRLFMLYTCSEPQEGQPAFEYHSFIRHTNGALLPSLNRVIYHENLPSGACYRRIETEEFSDHLLVLSSGERKSRNQVETISLAVFPNPSSKYITLNTSGLNPKQVYLIEIFNLQGDRVFKSSLENINTQHSIQLKDLPQGLYTLRLSGNDVIKTTNFIIQ